MPLGGIERTVHAVAVELTGEHVGKVDVPDFIGIFLEREPMRFLLRVDGVEKAELDLGRILREEGEIHPGSVPGSAQGIRMAWP